MRNLLSLTGLLLACCGGPAATENPFTDATGRWTNGATNVRGVDHDNRFSAALERMPAADRFSTLAQAVRSTERRCSSVSTAQYKGALDQRAFWAVACDAGDYLLVIAGDGSVTAQTCRVQQANGPGCWVEW